MSEALLQTLSLLAALQKERAIAIVDTASHYRGTIRPFEEQSNDTHGILSQAQKKNLDFWVLLPDRFFEAYALRNNEEFRASLLPVALMDWYHFNLELPIYQLALSHLTNHDSFSPAQTSALVHFVASLGYLAQLRDLGIMTFIKAEIAHLDVNKMKNAAQTSLSRERLFLGLADEKLRQWMEEAKAPSLTTVGQMDQTLRKIKDGYAKGVIADSSIVAWLNLFNEEITLRHQALQRTIERLLTENKESASASMVTIALESDVEHQWETIQSIPLFRGVSDVTLRTLLKGAKLFDVDKNGVLFSQGDWLTRFAIIMEGWARTVKTTAEGQESIIQLLSKKECVLDQGLSNAMLAPFTLRAITRCRVLVLSLPVLMDHLSRNRELAQNLLAASTTRLGRLVSQYEQITLRTAEQRVGWFLVNLHLETGLEGEPLKLPFDKALIASYLNIKPETFSRVLAAFRARGFQIDKHQIVMPNPHALCQYCDPDMALRCCRAEASNCVPIQTARRARGE